MTGMTGRMMWDTFKLKRTGSDGYQLQLHRENRLYQHMYAYPYSSYNLRCMHKL